MQRIAAVLIVGGGLAFLASEYYPSPADREEQVAAMTRIVARATILEPKVVPAEQPGLRRPVASPAATYVSPTPAPVAVAPGPAATAQLTAPIAAPVAPAPAPATLAAVNVQTAVPVAPPAAAPRQENRDIQGRLAREIQSELKRVGCYYGRLDGSWGHRSRDAMAAFMARVNASLPTYEPDVFLLSLIKGQTSTVCGTTCAKGEVRASGRCVPQSVIAQNSSRDTRAVPAAEPVPAAPVVTATRAHPLPGRMAIGAPLPSSGSPPPPVTSARAAETLPWQAVQEPQPNARPELAALDAGETDLSGYTALPPPPRKVKKAKRSSWSPPPPRAKPSKRRYGTRAVQTLFLHPLGRM